MKKNKVAQNTSSSMRKKVIQFICFTFFIGSFNFAFSQHMDIKISCSEFDAQIFSNGQLEGRGSVEVKIIKENPLHIKITKDGYITDEFTIYYGGGYGRPEKKYYRILAIDPNYKKPK